jgi:EAL domain-containing protein (putative c-di-GMP-specific phosphodiesterase class I)
MREPLRLELETSLRQALENNEFVLHYQPKVALRENEVIGFEALIRWNHPERGLVPPSEFIPIAEETGLIVPMTLWVLQEACSQLVEWNRNRGGGSALTVSVNISRRQLSQADFAEQLAAIVASSGVPAGALRIEVTETTLMEDPEAALETLQKVKAIPVGIEMDDFGTGYSSLGNLQQFPFDTLKIDRSFIQRLGTDEECQQIVQAIIGLASGLGMKVVAEGVETQSQLQYLTSLGCEQVQGFYFSPPVNARQATEIIQSGIAPAPAAEPEQVEV